MIFDKLRKSIDAAVKEAGAIRVDVLTIGTELVTELRALRRLLEAALKRWDPFAPENPPPLAPGEEKTK